MDTNQRQKRSLQPDQRLPFLVPRSFAVGLHVSGYLTQQRFRQTPFRYQSIDQPFHRDGSCCR